MERLTERDEYGNADIVGVESADLQLNLECFGKTVFLSPQEAEKALGGGEG